MGKAKAITTIVKGTRKAYKYTKNALKQGKKQGPKTLKQQATANANAKIADKAKKVGMGVRAFKKKFASVVEGEVEKATRALNKQVAAVNKGKPAVRAAKAKVTRAKLAAKKTPVKKAAPKKAPAKKAPAKKTALMESQEKFMNSKGRGKTNAKSKSGESARQAGYRAGRASVGGKTAKKVKKGAGKVLKSRITQGIGAGYAGAKLGSRNNGGSTNPQSTNPKASKYFTEAELEAARSRVRASRNR